ncbi:MAG: hypothetical protein AAF599_19310, partial [Bacteroidota bacterium]
RKAMHPIYHLLKLYDEKGLLTPVQQALVKPMPQEELYDLEKDPYEIHNLARDSTYTRTLNESRNKLLEWQQEVKDYGMESDSEALEIAFTKYGIESNERYQAKIEAKRKAVLKMMDDE